MHDLLSYLILSLLLAAVCVPFFVCLLSLFSISSTLQFVRVGHHTMGAMQLTIFVRRTLVPRVKLVKMKDVACGVGNVLQNKGAVACFLR